MSLEEEKPSPAEIRSRLRLCEDHNLAMKLQEEEFNTHYDRNRVDRRVVGNDTKKTKEEQIREDAMARELRRQQNRHIVETDEEMARRMQQEWEMEERRLREEKERQEILDAEIAIRFANMNDTQTEENLSMYSQQQPRPSQFGHTSNNPYSASTNHLSSSPSAYNTSPSTSDPDKQNAINAAAANLARGGIPLPCFEEIRRISPLTPTNDPFDLPSRPPNYDTSRRLSSSRPIMSQSVSVDSPALPPPPPSWIQHPSAAPLPFQAFQTSQIPNIIGQGSAPNVINPSNRIETTFPVTEYSREDSINDLPLPPPPSQISQQSTAVFQPIHLEPTNPFLIDVTSNASHMGINQHPIQNEYLINNNMFNQPQMPPPNQPPPSYQSEFGLPPPSELAMGGRPTYGYNPNHQ